MWFTILDSFNHPRRQTESRVGGVPKLGPKILGILLLGAVGVSISYFILVFYNETFPEYAYTPYPDRQPDPGIASVPRTHSLLPSGPAALTPPADVPPATPVRPTVPPTPTPLSVQESAPTMALLAPTPGVGPTSATAPPPRNAPHGLGPSASLAASPGRPEFHVQAGAFKQREYADAIIRQLRANGYTVALAEGAVLRVWVGSAMSRTAAERLAANLRSNGFDAFLTPVR